MTENGNSKEVKSLIRKYKPYVEYVLGVEIRIRYKKTWKRRSRGYKDPYRFSGVIYIGLGMFEEYEGYELKHEVMEVLTHEAIHLRGLNHNREGHRLGFYSHKDDDIYTPKIMEETGLLEVL